ncbi:MAG: hypothetical protein LRY66_15620 [Saccharospirillaceae bacterium]|nr:hypothetical protein [Saccharospirillaceae bacterium]MCD8532735.1 hypothetical protein [Saccharospirillaceae bacterium]
MNIANGLVLIFFFIIALNSQAAELILLAGAPKITANNSQVTDEQFHKNRQLQGGVIWRGDSFLGFEFLAISNMNSRTKESADVVGLYELNLDIKSLGGGVRLQLPLSGHWRIALRAGGLIHQTRMTVYESFYGLKPSGEAQTNDQGQGYYYGLAADYHGSGSLGFSLHWDEQYLPDVFNGSSHAFDVKISGFSAGLSYRF